MSDPAGRLLRVRPLAVLGASACVGCAAGCFGGVPAFIWACGLMLCAALFAVRRGMAFLMLAVLFSFAATARTMLPVNDGPVLSEAIIEGTVREEIVEKPKYRAVTLENVRVDGKRLGCALRVNVYDGTALETGDRMTFQGATWRPSAATNPGAFDYALWLWKRGVGLCATCFDGGVLSVEKRALSVNHLFVSMRRRAAEAIGNLFGDRADLVKALVLSDKTDMDEARKDAFTQAGLAHILAVSGMHITCLALCVDLLLRRLLTLGRKTALCVTAALLLLYGAMIGFPASVLRATVMYLVFRAAPLTGRPSDTLTNIALAALALLTWNPLNVTDAGFQLSFLSVTGIVTGANMLARLCHMPLPDRFTRDTLRPASFFTWLRRKSGVLLCVGVAAFLGSLPCVASTYGAFTPLSPVTGLLALPCVTMALPLSILSLVTRGVPVLGRVMLLLANAFLWALDAIARVASSLSVSSVRMPAWPCWLIWIYYAMAVCCWPHFHVPKRWRVCALTGMLACAAAAYPLAYLAMPDGLEVCFLDAGQADAMAVHAERETYLVDVGLDGSPVPDYLLHTGQTPKAIFLTHPHADHAGGLSDVMKVCGAETIYVPCTWPYCEHDAEADAGMRDAQARGARVVYLARGDTVRLSQNVTAEVLYPEQGARYAEGNAASLVLLLRYGDGSVLLTGDVTPGSATILPDADLMKIAHHGSRFDTSGWTMRQTTPTVAVISVGRNSFGHPAQSVIDAAKAVGAAVYRTDENGMVSVEIARDGALAVSTYGKG